MKTSADLRPYVITALATVYLVAFWAFVETTPAKAPKALEARAPVATKTVRTAPVVRGRIRTRSS